MLVRILVGAGCGLCALGLAFLTDTPVLPAVMAVLSFLCEFELTRCAGTLRRPALSVPSLLIAAAAPAAAGFVPADAFHGYALPVSGAYLVFAAAVYTVCAGRAEKDSPSISLEQAAVTGFFTLYTAIGFSSVVLICRTENGFLVFPLIFIAAWGTDVFAFFSGYFFGKHKLIPAVSPKKTVEGAIGGTLICTLIFVVYSLIAGVISGGSVEIDIILLAILGVLSSAVAQIGDLIMSAVKRSYGIKDFGKVLPGHGGFLDRFDSVLSVSTVFYLFITVFNMFKG